MQDSGKLGAHRESLFRHTVDGVDPAPAFKLLRDLISERTGVFFSDSKQDQLEDRVAEEIASRGLQSLLDYYYLLKYDPDGEAAWTALANRLAVPETYFWRQPDQFESLANVLLPIYHAQGLRRPLRIWSAACCSGEEPLSIAMALHEGGWFDRMPIEIVGSDASSELVARARQGVYPERSLRSLDDERRERYFTPGPTGWTIDPELHGRVQWTVANLVKPSEITTLAEADVIFCRNVFIYFSDDTIRRVVRVFAERMPDSGHLFLGASESLMRLATEFDLDEIGAAFVYRKRSTEPQPVPAGRDAGALAPN